MQDRVRIKVTEQGLKELGGKGVNPTGQLESSATISLGSSENWTRLQGEQHGTPAKGTGSLCFWGGLTCPSGARQVHPLPQDHNKLTSPFQVTSSQRCSSYSLRQLAPVTYKQVTSLQGRNRENKVP